MADLNLAQQWLALLESRLSSRAADMQKLDDWYTGNHPFPFLTKTHDGKIKDEFRQLLEESQSNFMQLVVDVVEERLGVVGFRLSGSSDKQADKRTWDIWQANQMDANIGVALLEALIKGVSYLSIWGDGEDASIAVEDPTQTIIGYAPGSGFQRRAAALKLWTDDWTGIERANVYLPDGIWKFQRAADGDTGARVSGSENQFGGVQTPVRSKDALDARAWAPFADDPFVENPLGVVPIVPLRNRPRLLVEGASEIASVYKTQAQINGFLFLLALAGYFGAHRQRWAAGIALMEDNAGQPIEPFDTAVDKLWVSENPEAKFGEFSQTDLDGYVKSIEQKVGHISVITRTPRHYLIQQGQSPSGDAIKSAESGLTKKVGKKQRPFGEGIEEALRLARMFAGESDAPVDSEVEWADPEIRTEAELTDATIKKFQARLISREQALEDLGYSPQQIARMDGGTFAEQVSPAEPAPAADMAA